MTLKERIEQKEPGRFDDVEFEMMGSDGLYETVVGSVLIRKDAMVIDIPEQDGLYPCLVVGNLNGRVYSGRNTYKGSSRKSVGEK